VTVITLGLAILLWSRRPLSACQLRELELTLFGSTVSFIGWLQYQTFAHPEFLNWALTDSSEAVAGALNVTVAAASLRWFFLIVLYGVFIPNTWQRCASVVGGLALAALLLTAGPALANESLRTHLAMPMVTMAVLMLAGMAIAIFGSRRIYFLEQEASQA